MRRAVPLLLVLAALAGCGGSSRPKPRQPGPAEVARATLHGQVRAAQVGGAWAVAWTTGASPRAVVEKREHGRWRLESSTKFTLSPLGPRPGGTAAATPQVAVEIRAPTPIVDTALLVDGTPVDTRGGGPTSSYISIYGAPATPLAKGPHVAVAFARAGTSAAAVAWRFTVSG